MEIKLHKNVILEISKQSIETETKADFLLTPEISPKYLTIRETFYIDNVSSTRLQNGTSKNILTVRQLNESLVRGLARAWQLKKLIEKGKTTREWEKASGMNKRTFVRYLNLCYLSPKIVADILEYKKPSNMTLKDLMNLAEGEVWFVRREKIWKGSTGSCFFVC